MIRALQIAAFALLLVGPWLLGVWRIGDALQWAMDRLEEMEAGIDED